MPLRKVKTENGWVEGLGCGMPSHTVFKSIPFAKPPIGDLRWKAPQPMDDWDGVYQAFQFKAIPPMIKNKKGMMAYDDFDGFGATEIQDENCLHLSIWTPAQSADERLPVFFHIHGGGFVEGYSYANTFDGEAFTKQGVIFVSIEYRVGMLGFMAHPELSAESEYGASGNYGLLDQLAALKWVKRNIAAFGGDPDNITINGQSGGCRSCTYLMYSPLAKGLFNKAVLQSGSGFLNNKKTLFDKSMNNTLSEAENIGASILEGLGVSSIEEARKLPWETILEFQDKHPELKCWQCIDGYFLKESADTTAANNDYENIPVIIGSTTHEGKMPGFPQMIELMDPQEYESAIKETYGKYADRFLELTGFYEDPVESMEYSGMSDERPAGAIAWCEQAVKNKYSQPVYLYTFTKPLPGTDFSCHSTDLWYTFNTLRNCVRPLKESDYTLANTMNAYFANFAKTGDPNGEGLPKWERYRASKRSSMELGEHIGMITNICSRRVSLVVDYIMSED